MGSRESFCWLLFAGTAVQLYVRGGAWWDGSHWAPSSCETLYVINGLTLGIDIHIYSLPMQTSWNTVLLSQHSEQNAISCLFLFLRFYLFLDRREGREKESERNVIVWLPLTHPILKTWPTTQARALTGNRTSDPVVRRLVLNPLSHSSQGTILFSWSKNIMRS